MRKFIPQKADTIKQQDKGASRCVAHCDRWKADTIKQQDKGAKRGYFIY